MGDAHRQQIGTLSGLGMPVRNMFLFPEGDTFVSPGQVSNTQSFKTIVMIKAAEYF
jgi:hypothetical protein